MSATAQEEAPCRFLEWDSTFWACRIGELTDRAPSATQFAAAIAWATTHQLECLYYLAAGDATSSHHTAESLGFRLMDLRLTLARSTEGFLADSSPLLIRLAEPLDEEGLAAMARHNHGDSRFYSDPHFPRERCDELYATWIVNSCHGFADSVFVAEASGSVLGYTTCHLKTGTGSLGLVGVHPAAQGQQVGRHLVHHALEWFRNQGVERVEVVTQGRNQRAVRFYQRMGFLISNVELWFHRWELPTEVLHE